MRKSTMLLFVSFVACGKSRELPSAMTGTYSSKSSVMNQELGGGSDPITGQRIELHQSMGFDSELTVTQTGISKTGGMQMPAMKVGPITTGGPTADTFTSVECKSATSCSFKTKGGCEGTIEQDAQGVRVIATGACSDWSGSWTRR